MAAAQPKGARRPGSETAGVESEGINGRYAISEPQSRNRWIDVKTSERRFLDRRDSASGQSGEILTAHVSSASSRFDVARKRRVGAEMALVLGGKWPRACVNPAVLDKSKLERWQPFSMARGPGN